MNRDTVIIIPAYNEGAVIRKVVAAVSKKFTNVICINDGSSDNTESEIRKTSAVLINHPINLGQGAALQTGVEYALLKKSTKYFVTYDADGQHSLKDVSTMLKYIRKNDVDIVLGSRFLGEAKNVSGFKKLMLKGAVIFSNTMSGIKLTDTHNGLRVFNRRVAEKLNITMSDMSHASEIIQRIADEKFSFAELPVTVTYSDYSLGKSHNPSLNVVNIVFDTVLQKVTRK